VVLTLAFGAGGGPPVLASAGDLDTALGGTGIVSARVGQVSDVYVRDSGKVVIAGVRHDVMVDGQKQDVAVIEKRLANGRLDTSFGTDGRVLIHDAHELHGSWMGIDPKVLVADQDGSIIVALTYATVQGDEGGDVTSGEGALLRLTRRGRIDTTFGTAGRVTFTAADIQLYGRITDLMVDGRGRITVAYQSWHHSYSGRPGDGRPTGCPGDMSYSCDRAEWAHIIKLGPDGNPSKGFDGDGVATWHVTRPDQVEPVAIAASGRGVAVLLNTFQTEPTGTVQVARVNANGTWDTGFGSGGTAPVSPAGQAVRAFDLAARPTGGFVVGVDVISGQHRLAMMALTATGLPDSTFSGDGWESRLLGLDTIGGGVVIAPGGTIYVAASLDSSLANPLARGIVLATRRNGQAAGRFGDSGEVWFAPGAFDSLRVPAVTLSGVRPAVVVAVDRWNSADPSADRGAQVRAYVTR
jgi:uncharacterized delta-60 repeat protein